MPRKPKPIEPNPSPARIADARPPENPRVRPSEPRADVEGAGGDLARDDRPDDGKGGDTRDVRIGPGGV